MGRKKSEKMEGKEEIIIDLTLTDDETDSESEKSTKTTTTSFTPFDPPLNISGNILESRHYKILKSNYSWFTDDIINAFFYILKTKNEDKCYAVSSFFYDSLLGKGKEYCLKHWTKGIRTFLSSSSVEDKIILLPVNSGGSHWVLLVWFVDEGTLRYYDSMMCKRSGNLIMKRMSEFFNEMLKEYNEDEVDEDDNEDIDKLLSKLSINNSKVPFIKNNLIPKGQLKQTDGSSCGPFCCLNGKRLFEATGVVDVYEFRESLIDYFIESVKNLENVKKVENVLN